MFRLRMPALPLPSAVVSRAPAGVPGRASQPATRHTVVTGDTLWAIAGSAGVDVRALAAANGLSENAILKLGRVLTVPRPGTPAPVRAAIPRGAISRAAAPVRSSVPSRAAAAPAPPFGSARRLALLWPSRGIVTSRFGWRIHPIFGSREFHTGVDIATRYGSPVVAARAGVVRFVGWKSGYGRIIVIAHGGGIETAYSHLSAALVNPGQRVAQGQMIGRIGSSGWSTGPHLFFEVRRNGVPMDPARYLN
ncbi:MAG: LysM peptidoglycan-binding domain-containing M23 family metallopeptidase [bacterium]